MEKAKSAINDFMNKSGHKDTTVHETVAPAVQHETVKPHQHEEVMTAVDKEVHQDHYHRTVQPIQDREVLPEKHTHNLGAVQHREVDHRDHDSTKRALQTEQAGFKNERVVDSTSHSQTAAPVVGGEHVHHHIHETIQPVVNKETIQPHVVHTTVPIHETHHNAAQHHQTSTLPTVSMSDFQSRGGVLGGREERYDGFEGEPKNIGGAVAAGLKGSHHRDDSHQSSTTHGHGLSGGNTTGAIGRHETQHGDYDDVSTHGKTGGLTGNSHSTTGGLTGNSHNTTGSGLTGNSHNTAGSGLTGNSHSTTRGTDGLPSRTDTTTGGLTGNSHSHRSDERGVGALGAGATHSDRTTHDKHDLTHDKHSKPSLMDKLNPKVDADGDGKPGIMK